VVNLVTVEGLIDESLVTERMLATLSASFGALALLLSIVGLYGVMTFVVTQRTQEIGIRMALGAQRSAAVWLVLCDAFIMIAAGIALALPAVWALSRFVDGQLFGIQALDGTNIAAASAILALVAVGAALHPAWRATTISPLQALRQD
jgi:ABC-type antimicrobial peptide transport system permease subunit